MTVEGYLAFLATVAVFFAHPPGPSQVLFMANSSRFGVRSASPTIAGDLSANAVQIVIAGFGLTGIIAVSATIFSTVTWVGVGYLLWIGVRTALTRRTESAGTSSRSAQRCTLFRQGFLTSAANPYAVVFFGALFPQFIHTDAALFPQILVLGLTYLVIDGAVLVALGSISQHLVTRFSARDQRWVNRISGALMIGAAVLLSFKDVGSARPAGIR